MFILIVIKVDGGVPDCSEEDKKYKLHQLLPGIDGNRKPQAWLRMLHVSKPVVMCILHPFLQLIITLYILVGIVETLNHFSDVGFRGVP